MDDKVLHVARLAMMSGQVNRAVQHPGGKPESDTDHAVMVAWVACSLARRWYPHLDAGLICQLAIAHDACEVYAGDLVQPTATEAQREAQAVRERQAIDQIAAELGPDADWLPAMADAFEDLPEARFVRIVDKLCPKIAILVFDPDAWRRLGRTPAKTEAFWEREKRGLEVWAADFPEMIRLWDELNGRLRKLFRVASANA